jgi:hypothetical protein
MHSQEKLALSQPRQTCFSFASGKCHPGVVLKSGSAAGLEALELAAMDGRGHEALHHAQQPDNLAADV